MKTTPEPHYSLVIPAYNEENRIIPLFDAITSFDGELIVVCDGNDRTAEVVEAIASRRRELLIRSLRFERPARERGRGFCRSCCSPCAVCRVF